jgi:cytochrome c oxidase assembly protein subunit 15
MSSSAVTKQQPKEVARREDDSDVIEETETSSKASASVRDTLSSKCARQSRTDVNCPQAGLNLNIFGAIAGAFSSKSSKQIEDDGSSKEVREENLAAKGMSPVE